MRRNINSPKKYLEHSSASQQEMFVEMIKANPTKSPNRIDQLRRNLASPGSERQNIRALTETQSRRMGNSPRSRGISVISKTKGKKQQKREEQHSDVRLGYVPQPLFLCCDEQQLAQVKLGQIEVLIQKIQTKKIQHNVSPPIQCRKEQKQQCQVCYEKCNKKEMVEFGSCGHKYCGACLKKHINNFINSFKIVKCLNEDCTQSLDISSPHIQSLELHLQQRYYKIRVLFNNSKDQDIRICPSENCEGFIKLSDDKVQCPICYVSFCKKCLYPMHTGNCDQNGALYLTDKFNYKKCSKCNMVIEKNQGCKHMTCKCGYQFCYICGEKWAADHNCKPSVPAPAPVRPPVSAPLRAAIQASNPVQPSTFACCNPCNILKTTILAIFFALLVVLFCYPIFMCILVPILASIFFFFYSIGAGMKEMVENESCLKIFLLNIFLLFYYALPFYFALLIQFFRTKYCNSSLLALDCLFPISYILYHEMKECMF